MKNIISIFFVGFFMALNNYAADLQEEESGETINGVELGSHPLHFRIMFAEQLLNQNLAPNAALTKSMKRRVRHLRTMLPKVLSVKEYAITEKRILTMTSSNGTVTSVPLSICEIDQIITTLEFGPRWSELNSFQRCTLKFQKYF